MKPAANYYILSQKVNKVKQALQFFISDTTEDQISNVIQVQSTVDAEAQIP